MAAEEQPLPGNPSLCFNREQVCNFRTKRYGLILFDRCASGGQTSPASAHSLFQSGDEARVGFHPSPML